MRLLNTYDSEATAFIDKGFLETHSIPAYVDHNAMSDVFPAPNSGSSSIGLYVDDDQLEAARRLLASRPE